MVRKIANVERTSRTVITASRVYVFCAFVDGRLRHFLGHEVCQCTKGERTADKPFKTHCCCIHLQRVMNNATHPLRGLATSEVVEFRNGDRGCEGGFGVRETRRYGFARSYA